MVDKETQILIFPRVIIFRNYKNKSKVLVSTESQSPDRKNLPTVASGLITKLKRNQSNSSVKLSAPNPGNYPKVQTKKIRPVNLSIVNMNFGISKSQSSLRKPKKKDEVKLIRNIHTVSSTSKFKKVSESSIYKLDSLCNN
jgi:hypothetical protein